MWSLNFCPPDAGPGRQHVSVVFCALVLATVASGCASRTTPVALPSVEALRDAPDAPYAIHVGDVLDIRFYTAPELNAEVAVRSDGCITLEPVGDVLAAGKPPAVLADELYARYAVELRQPDVTVMIKGFGGQVYVVGEVGKPAALNFATGMTALQAISGVGGFLDSAQKDSVVLIRQQDSQPFGYRLALHEALSGEDQLADVRVQPADIIYVPRSRVGNVNSFVQRYIKDNLPMRMGIGASYRF
jgi:protein involved in polysaccharide export with SLBB domain